ncbi:uncharacterized protein LOC135810868 isoform X1 [Sycon ciliatum]|uniref:uncharacterized protein LOC135810868 isoform X1 n=1 Tax=Sycon ciliatum TaxID=27933 RepID=UPI0031F62FBA
MLMNLDGTASQSWCAKLTDYGRGVYGPYSADTFESMDLGTTNVFILRRPFGDIPVFWYKIRNITRPEAVATINAWKTSTIKGLDVNATIKGYSSVKLYSERLLECARFTITVSRGKQVPVKDRVIRLLKNQALISNGDQSVKLYLFRNATSQQDVAYVCFLYPEESRTSGTYHLTVNYLNQHTTYSHVEQTVLHSFNVTVTQEEPPTIEGKTSTIPPVDFPLLRRECTDWADLSDNMHALDIYYGPKLAGLNYTAAHQFCSSQGMRLPLATEMRCANQFMTETYGSASLSWIETPEVTTRAIVSQLLENQLLGKQLQYMPFSTQLKMVACAKPFVSQKCLSTVHC